MEVSAPFLAPRKVGAVEVSAESGRFPEAIKVSNGGSRRFANGRLNGSLAVYCRQQNTEAAHGAFIVAMRSAVCQSARFRSFVEKDIGKEKDRELKDDCRYSNYQKAKVLGEAMDSMDPLHRLGDMKSGSRPFLATDVGQALDPEGTRALGGKGTDSRTLSHECARVLGVSVACLLPCFRLRFDPRSRNEALLEVAVCIAQPFSNASDEKAAGRIPTRKPLITEFSSRVCSPSFPCQVDEPIWRF